MPTNADTMVICGAGIAGSALAYYLSRLKICKKIMLIDRAQPLSYTTSKSGENFRDYWPHPCMEQLSSRSIELMQDLRKQHRREAFDMRFSGYHFVSHQRDKPIFTDDNTDEFRIRNEVETNSDIIHRQHPYLDSGVQKSVFIKKAGDIDVYALGSLLIREAKKMGVQLLKEEIVGVSKKDLQYEIILASNKKIIADGIVIAAGPFINNIARMLDLDFPVSNTLQRKFIMPDPLHLIPPDMPFTIYADDQYLDWSADQTDFFESNQEYRWLLKKFPGGLHVKPESGGKVKMGWAFQHKNEEPLWDPPKLDLFPQVVLKGASRFIPEMNKYEDQPPAPIIEYGGYYTRTKENWPLIGPTQLEGVYIIGALSGFGTMTACAAGELCTSYIAGMESLPSYAPYFHPDRYKDSEMIEVINSLSSDGQL